MENLKIRLAAKFFHDERAISNAESEVNSSASTESRESAIQNLNEILDQVDNVTYLKLDKQFLLDGVIFDEFVPDKIEDMILIVQLINNHKGSNLSECIQNFDSVVGTVIDDVESKNTLSGIRSEIVCFRQHSALLSAWVSRLETQLAIVVQDRANGRFDNPVYPPS